MPRTSGRSSLTTTAPIRRSPNERNESRCCLVPPIRDLIWVTFSCAMSPRSARARRGGRGRTCAQHGRRGHILDRQPALGRDLLGPVEALERRDGRVHHVDRDRKSTRLNSCHVEISYAVFCLKKKKKSKTNITKKEKKKKKKKNEEEK